MSEERFVDFDDDQTLFKGMLEFKDDCRILLIEDGGARGKSTFLERLKEVCLLEIEPSVPVSLVTLDTKEAKQHQNDPLLILDIIRTDLKDLGIELATFAKLNKARASKDSEAFSVSSAAAGRGFGTVDARNARVEGSGIAAGTYIANNYSPLTDWNDAMERQAREECIEAFFGDLKLVAKDQTTVLLLDCLDEKADKNLRTWITDKFIHRLLKDPNGWPLRFVMVLAGRELPPLLRAERFEARLRSALGLNWKVEHVRDFLKRKGHTALSDLELNMLSERLRNGASLIWLEGVVEAMEKKP